MRGKANLGDKTMLDTIIPALDSLKENYEAGNELDSSLKESLEVAEEAMESTVPMLAKKGRASYLIIKTIIKELA